MKLSFSYISNAWVFLLLAVLLFSSSSVLAQPLDREERSGSPGSDGAYGIRTTPDSGYIMVGYSDSSGYQVSGNHGSFDIWIQKRDSSGSLQWEDNYGGLGSDRARDVEVTSDKGFIVVGTSTSDSIDLSGNKGGEDVWLVKLDSSGNLEWQRNYGGSDLERGFAVEPLSGGGYVFAGRTQSTDGDVTNPKGNIDAWLVKVNGSGSIQWAKNYGGSSNDEVKEVEQTAGGGFILCGSTASSDGDVSGSPLGGWDQWVLKLDASGNIQWEENFGGSDHDRAYSVRSSSDGGYVAVGSSRSDDGDLSGNHGGYDQRVVKLDASGNVEWKDHYGGSLKDEAFAVKETPKGYLLLGGSRSTDHDVSGNKGSTDLWLLAIDDSGAVKGDKNYGASAFDVGASIDRAKDGGYVMAGVSDSNGVIGSGGSSQIDQYFLRTRGPCEAFPLPLALDTTTVCEGDSVVFRPLQDDLFIGEFVYRWEIDSGSGWELHSTNAGPELLLEDLAPSDSGHRFRCIIKDSCGGADTSDVGLLGVKEGPKAVIDGDSTVTSISPNAYLYGGNSKSPSGSLQYQWKADSGGTISSGQNSADVEVFGDGLYILTVTDPSTGCQHKDSLFVEDVSSIPSNGRNRSLSIEPNPVRSRTRLKFGASQERIELRLRDLQGRVHRERSYSHKKRVILEWDGAPGVYFLEVRTETGSWVRKLVKE